MPHDNPFSFWHSIMICHTCIDHDPRRTSTNFGANRSEVMVKFGFWSLHWFCTITPLFFDIRWCYLTHVLPVTRGASLLIWCQEIIVRLGVWNLLYFRTVNLIFWTTIMVLHTWFCSFDPRRTPIDFWVERSKVKTKLWMFEFVAGGVICPIRIDLDVFDLIMTFCKKLFISAELISFQRAW